MKCIITDCDKERHPGCAWCAEHAYVAGARNAPEAHTLDVVTVAKIARRLAGVKAAPEGTRP
jgi:hypothetical protein